MNLAVWVERQRCCGVTRIAGFRAAGLLPVPAQRVGRLIPERSASVSLGARTLRTRGYQRIRVRLDRRVARDRATSQHLPVDKRWCRGWLGVGMDTP